MILLNAIELPSDLIWVDEYDWSPVTQTVKRSLSGALIVQEAAQAKGRPVTLEGDENSAWITKATLEQLRLLEAQADNTMTLNYFGTEMSVRFRRESSAAIQARQVVQFSNPDGSDFYSVTLRFITV